MTDQLTLYNGAARELGENPLASLTDPVKLRRALDSIWPQAAHYCLEMGLWTFATRSVEIAHDPDLTPGYHYQYAFTPDTDLLRLAAVYEDPNENVPCTRYSWEAGHFYANVDPLFVQYISKDARYGMNLSVWPSYFCLYVETHMATLLCEPLTQNANKYDALFKLEERRLRDASNRNVMDKPARFPPQGEWARSRLAGWRSGSLRGTGRGL